MIPAAFDFADPFRNLEAFGRLWGSYAPGGHLGVFHGTMYAIVGSEALIPLFDYAGTGITCCRLLEDGHLQMRGKETGFFCDTATGEVIDRWDNPFTGEQVDVFHFLNDRIGAVIGPEMPRLTMGDAEPGVAPAASVPFVLPWHVCGDEVLLDWHYAHSYRNPVDPMAWPRASTGPMINPSEHFVLYASLAELTDPSCPDAAFRGGFSRTSPWWPWMRMGADHPGVMFGSLFSRTARRGHDDIPTGVRRRIEERHRDFLVPPDDWDTGPILSSWEAYARDVPPEA